jgi:hypothetical protein
MKATLTLLITLYSLISYGQKEVHILQGRNPSSKIITGLHPEFSFLLPEMAGNLKFGVIKGNESKWLESFFGVEFSHENNRVKYSLQDAILGEGKLIIEAISLTKTDGLVVQVEAKNLPEGIQLFWSFGGSFGKVTTEQELGLKPEYCKYNVFSVEGSLFTVYYGESMKLKVFQAVTPLNSEIRLSDAFQQSSPLEFFNSGKKTTAPALAAIVPLKKNDKQYFSFYRQSAEADYNTHMLPEVFSESFKKSE